MRIYQISNKRVGLLTETGTKETLEILTSGLEALAKVATNASVIYGVDSVAVYDYEHHVTVLGYQWELQ